MTPDAENKNLSVNRLESQNGPGQFNGEVAGEQLLAPESSVTELLQSAGYDRGSSFYGVRYLKKPDAVVILGIPDLTRAIAIQTLAISRLQEYSQYYRGICGSKFALWCTPFDHSNTGDDKAEDDYNTYWSDSECVDTTKFFPELITITHDARVILADEGIIQFSDYKAIDTDQQYGGIDIGGIQDPDMAQRIHAILTKAFPNLPHGFRYFETQRQHERGWRVLVHALLSRDRDGDEFGKLFEFAPFDRHKEWSLFIGYSLISHCQKERGGALLPLIGTLRQELSQVGILLPTIRIRDDLNLDPLTARLEIDGKIAEYLPNVEQPQSIIDMLSRATWTMQEPTM